MPKEVKDTFIPFLDRQGSNPAPSAWLAECPCAYPIGYMGHQYIKRTAPFSTLVLPAISTLRTKRTVFT